MNVCQKRSTTTHQRVGGGQLLASGQVQQGRVGSASPLLPDEQCCDRRAPMQMHGRIQQNRETTKGHA